MAHPDEPMTTRETAVCLLALSIRNVAHALRSGVVTPDRAAMLLDDYADELRKGVA